ncbi:SART-1 protein [Mycotypha africana]|uniref:SART-1 protein n=1 Tax=Mycotypha africana TaxID=64632 RepID=UPI00230199BF|nr:SART-1 protein [Mycotypha africana]KAI8988152.1 SART-1 protein [Mycotypha africana]
MAESLSIEETNALREKLGLPPLAADDDADEVADPDQVAYENYQKLKEEKEKAAKEEEIKKNIEKAKNRKRNLAKLQGKGLGEADDEEDDSALNWIRKSRKIEKDLAARRAKELEDMDNTYQKYDANQLAGLKVSHALSEFEEGGETILTLKDRGILEENDEEMVELSNVELEDRQRLKKNLEAKKQKPGYNPYDDDQFSGKKPSILPQYEENEEEKGFVIGQSGVVKPVQQEADEKSVAEKLKEQSLTYDKMQQIKDYYTQEEVAVSFKKPKSKKKKKMRSKNKDEDDLNISTTNSNLTEETSTQPSSVPKPHTLDPDANFVDDDDLQEALARARRIANKQKNKQFKRMTPEEIAKQLKQEATEIKVEDDDNGGLVLSETSEFVNSIGSNFALFNPRDVKKEATEPVIKTEPVEEYEINETTEGDQEATQMTEANEDSEMTEAEAQQATHEAEEAPAVKKEFKAEVIVEEPLVSRGLAATLNLLEQKGVIAKPTEEQLKRDRIAAEQIRWQNEMRKKERLRQLDDQIEKERRRGRGGRENSDRMRELEREREREREREERRRLKEFELAMENYKPEVNLEYTDDTGRVMKTVEAFKYMSHKFHGKTSGKTKTEKKMKKIEEERKLNMMSSTDTPHNLAGALLERQKRTGAAHVVLSVGNRGVVPTSTPLAPPSGSSSKSSKK